MMTTKEAIKVGFLARCADEGLDAAQAEQRAQALLDVIEKRAGALGDAGKIVGGAGKFGLGGLLLGIIGTMGLGYGGGRLIGSMQHDPLGPEEVAAESVGQNYDQLADKIRRDTALRRAQAQKGRLQRVTSF